MTENVYLQRQIVIFGCLYIGYFLYICTRKSFSFTTAVISEEEGLAKSDLGLIASSQAIAYTLGKFLSGLLVDRVSPKLLFSLGLLLCGLSTLTFTVCHSVWFFGLLWFINGLSNGPGWPACAKFMKRWYPAGQLGTLWSGLSTSMNVAGSVGPLLGMYLARQYGWRTGMQVPGIMAMLFAVVSQLLLCDKPTDVGLPEQIKDDREKKRGNNRTSGKVTLLDVVTPFFLKLCVGYLLTSCIRSASLDWGQLYLIQDRGHSHIVGSSFTSSQEIGGVVGSLIAGYASDKIVKFQSLQQTGSGRIIVVLINSVIITISLVILVTVVTETTSQLVISGVGFCLGFSLYGSIALYGVMAVESAPLHVSGSAYSIVAASANVGMILAGLPLSWVASLYQWEGAFALLLLGAALQVLLCLTCVYQPSGDTDKKIQ
ncbi:glucose-6-phosphate exchanger SLC37A4-like [Liolophura sinensis]|uniref:glucose-6-phosphate exchanger SLC37A4-like n=1 Tax=Liolophura sinensis TaxID=3198878 RepID=UPI0031596EE3